jgi:hypothetical protein
VRLVGVEEVEIAGAEDGSVEDLGDEGDALCATIAVNGDDKDNLGENVGDVS